MSETSVGNAARSLNVQPTYLRMSVITILARNEEALLPACNDGARTRDIGGVVNAVIVWAQNV